MNATILRILAVPPMAVLLLLCMYACAMGAVEEPPVQYQYVYPGELIVEYVQPHETAERCGYKANVPFAAKGYVTACAFTRFASPPFNRCKIIVPYNNGVWSEKDWKLIFLHEMAHCNGWTHK